ncbi:MAG: hypothetical protein WD928_05285 [Gammaproteobacteria bacterium]
MPVIDLAERRRLLPRKHGRTRPPPPHDPHDRILVDTHRASGASPCMSSWEVRIFDPAGQFHLYFNTTGFGHVQLWNPWYGISLLTPSRLTAGRYEAFPMAGWKYAANDYAHLARTISATVATTLPSLSQITAYCQEYAAWMPDGDGTQRAGAALARHP